MEVKTGYKESEVGTIPEDWTVRTAGDLCVKIQDGTHFSPDLGGDDYLYVTSKHIGRGVLDISSADRISTKEHRRIYSRCDVKKGDLLLTKDGANTGNAALNLLNEEFSLLSSVALLRFDTRYYISAYFLQCILSGEGQQRIAGMMSGNAITRLTLEKIRKLKFPLPPLPEQRAIAAALSDVDALIETLDALIAKKRAIKTATMQRLLTGAQRLPGFDGTWETKQLGAVAEICTGKKDNQDKVESGRYPFFVRSQTVERINTYSFEGEAILVPGEGRIGEVLHYVNGKFDYHQRVYKVSDFPEDVNSKYVYYYMTQHFGEQATRNSVKATVDSLRLPTFEEFDVQLPPIKEQEDIANTLSDMDDEIDVLQARREKTQAIKQGMMQELLTGRTRLV